MNNIKKYLFIFFIFIINYPQYADNLFLNKINLKKGFKIEIFAENIITARGLSVSPNGTVFVGSMNGSIYALKDQNNDFKIDKVFIIAGNLDMPVGVDYKDGDLYVSSVSKIIKFKNVEQNLGNPQIPIIINNTFPADKHHGWKFIKIGPDNKIYVPVGAPCNVCENADKRYASIMRMNLDGTELEIFAHGIRNTVGFDWNPLTNEIWFTDNGRDLMGDNIPPDELNHAPVKGLHFGFPYIHGKNIIDPQYGQKKPNINFTIPDIELGTHVAALGMRFYNGKMFPIEYQNQIFIAEHGSWNRSVPIGYRISLVKLENNKAVSYEVFAEGWLVDKTSWGRPVDVEIYYDGSLLVSDDKANVIYRIYYE